MGDELAQRLQPVKVVLLAMVFGVVGFAVVAYVLRRDGAFETNEKIGPLLLGLLGLLAMGELPAYFAQMPARVNCSLSGHSGVTYSVRSDRDPVHS